MTDIVAPSVERAWTELVHAHQAVLTAVEGALKRHGYPPLSWYDCLLELDRVEDGVLRPTVLEERLLLPQYGLSRLLSRMEKAGFIARRSDPEDRRAQFVLITDEGRALRRKMWPVYAEALNVALGEKLKDKQAQKLGKLLSKLR